MKKVKDENSKVRILEAATTLFAKKGFDGASIREICKAANVNLCMISYYWGGKRELYEGIIENLLLKNALNFYQVQWKNVLISSIQISPPI